jgi:Zn-dependent protease with chaperone function
MASTTRPASPKTKAANIREQVLGAIQGDIPPVPLTPLYKLGLLVGALAMVLLPAVYVALIGLAAYGFYAYAAWAFSSAQDGRLVFLAVVSSVVGPIVLLFMIKPLFARSAFHQTPRRLKREAEPLLFEYIERICEAVGAPAPRSIRVDCDVNASASFRRGIWSIFGQDLTLTIGLPLVAGMSLRQLSGVLAHEFGHFAQGAGMRLSYIIRSISYWFARAVYERDEWDERLEHWSKQIDLRLGIFLYIARLLIWCTRRVLWVLMWVGNAISCFLLREMEFDADRYEARLVGSKTFAKTARRLTELSVAHQMAIGDLQQFWDEGRLADDLPQLILANIKQITPELRKEIKKRDAEHQTGLFDTHPSNSDRIASAEREAADGIFHLDKTANGKTVPASILFGNFGQVSKIVSLQFYREVLGPEIDADVLHPVEELVSRQSQEIEAHKVLHRYFQGKISPLRPLPLEEYDFEPPANGKQNYEFIQKAREKVLAGADEYEKKYKLFNNADTTLLDSTRAIALLQANCRIAPADFNLKSRSLDEATSKSRQARSALKTLGGKLESFEQLAVKRLFFALQLLHHTKVQERIENVAQLHEEVKRLVPEAKFTNSLLFDLYRFRELYQGLVALCTRIESDNQNPALFEAILSKNQAIRTRLMKFNETLGNRLYPLEHAKADMTFREYVLPHVPEQDDLGGILTCCEMVLEKVMSVHIRLLARLAHAGEKVETALGLSPMPDPKDETAEADEE